MKGSLALQSLHMLLSQKIRRRTGSGGNVYVCIHMCVCVSMAWLAWQEQDEARKNDDDDDDEAEEETLLLVAL